MGNTIRRQPVNFNIPKAPDYKFLNVTDFKGLHITDNPFIGDPSSASDMLNLYVDEQNTLTTRPRLQKKFDLKESAIIPEEATIISINYVDNKYLVQYKYDEEVCIFWLVPTSENSYEYERIEINKSEKCSRIGESRIQIAKYGNIFVLVDGVSYKVIDENNNMCDASEKAYVPLTKINKEIGVLSSGTDYESPNILTSSCRESYGALVTDFRDVDFNWFADKKVTLTSDMGVNFEFSSSQTSNPNVLKYQPMGSYKHTKPITGVAVSEDGSVVCFAEKRGVAISTNGGKSFTLNNFQDMLLTNDGTNGVLMSSDGQYIMSVTGFGKDVINYIKSSDKGVTFKYVREGEATGGQFSKGAMSADGKHVVCAGLEGGTSLVIKSSANYGDTWATKMFTIEAPSLNTKIKTECSPDGEYFFVFVWDGDRINSSRNCICYYSKNNGVDWSELILDDIATTNNADAIEDIVVGSFAEKVVYDMCFKEDYWYFFTKNKNDISGESEVYRVLKTFNDTQLKRAAELQGGVGEAETITTTHSITNDLIFGFDEAVVDAFKYSTYVPNQLNFVTHETDESYIVSQSAGNPSIVTNLAGTDVWGCLGGLLYHNLAYSLGKDFITVETVVTADNDYLSAVNGCTFIKEFNNFLWFGGNKNFIAHSGATEKEFSNNPLYLPVKSKNHLGNDDNEITGFNISTDVSMIAYTKDALWLITRQEVVDGVIDYLYTETRSNNGHVAKGQTISTPLNEYPLQINNTGLFVYQPIENVLTSDKTSVLVTDKINPKLLKIKNLQDAIFINHLYWTLMFVPDVKLDKTEVFVYDDRDSSWYYWTFPEKLISAVNISDEIELTNEEGRHFTLETTDLINEFNPDKTEYYDDDKKLIEWFWTSQILHLGTMNYSKKLVDTTFIVADTDMSDEYALNYSFTVYRKMLSETSPTTISSKLNFVQSTTKRTLIPRFNFVQFKIANVDDDYDNNKLRLIGIGLKYVLLEGLLR